MYNTKTLPRLRTFPILKVLISGETLLVTLHLAPLIFRGSEGSEGKRGEAREVRGSEGKRGEARGSEDTCNFHFYSFI